MNLDFKNGIKEIKNFVRTSNIKILTISQTRKGLIQNQQIIKLKTHIIDYQDIFQIKSIKRKE